MIKRYLSHTGRIEESVFPSIFRKHLRDNGDSDKDYAQRLGLETHIVTQVKIGYIKPTSQILDDLGIKLLKEIDYEPKTVFEEVEKLYYVSANENADS